MKGISPPDTSYLSVSFTKFVAKIYFCESLVYYISFMMAYLQWVSGDKEAELIFTYCIY